ncbi:ABC transporter ATP-binding protein [Clostridium sp.]|uniref:ABC transporter ATP-binding protein n=1 Tax=Clostridium sp. TaxID=1506 RepID=UPI00284802A7|nr:ABC transporter ATP-binding protein [Clostridium sp.]MDR3596030.1 ABC transporter ATP-binding protein [Clostridium sp.]
MSENLLTVDGVTKRFGEFLALDNISFSIKYGETIGLIGKNGAGKTTLMKTILGLYKDFSGKIYYEEKLIDHSDPNVMNSIGSLVDCSFYEDMTAYDNLKIQMMGIKKVKQAVYKEKIMELLKFVDLENVYNKKVKSFSFGMKQRLGLVQSLLSEPKLLILDEPFVGLDPVGIELLKEKIHYLSNEKKVSIIFSSHQLKEVEDLCKKILVIGNKKVIYDGLYSELNSNKFYTICLNGSIQDNEIINKIKNDKNLIKEISIKDSCIKFNNINLLSEILEFCIRNNLKIKDIDVQKDSLMQFFINN